MPILDQPSISENSESMQFVVPADARDFSQPKETFMAHSISNTMADSLLADDEDSESKFVKQVQSFMKGSPAGVTYSGPVDGVVNPQLKSSIFKLESKIEELTGNAVIGTILFGTTISPTGFNRAISFLPKNSSKKEKSNEKIENLTKSFQEFFSNSQPIIGKLYSGPIDGVMNDELKSAALKAESIIGNTLGTDGVKGKIWGGNNFSTSPSDIQTALELIKENKKASMKYSKLLKLASEFEKKSNDDDDFFGFGSWQKEQEEKEKREIAEDKEKNAKILEKVLKLVNSLDGPSGTGGLDEYYIEKIMEYRRYSYGHSGFVRSSFSWQLNPGFLDLGIKKIDMETGEVIPHNLRFVYKGVDIPPELKSKIEKATGKKLEYYRPDKVWVWDAQINSKIKSGDNRLFSLTKEILS